MKKLFLGLMLAAAALSAQAACYSEGVRTGFIQKFSQKGLINKSWEGEMVQEGFRTKVKDGRTAPTNIWKFSTVHPEVAKALDAAVFEGKEVAVRYCELQWKGFDTDTPYIITAVKPR